MSSSEPAGEARSRAHVTRLLHELGHGDRQSAEELLPLVYEELRALARARMRHEGPGHTLQATVLVHEAYLRLVGSEDPGWNGRGHFFGAAARAMRRILVESARRRNSLRRGGDRVRIELDDVLVDGPEVAGVSSDVLAIEEAVERLERSDARKGEIVNLRYFAGLTNEETAAAMGLSVGTVEREWRFIRSWLKTELSRRPS